MNGISDSQLVEQYLTHRDEHALEALVERYISAVFGYVKRLTGNQDTAADITQETFVKAWKNLGRYKASLDFRGWLFTIAKRTAIDELRKKKAVSFSLYAADSEEDFSQLIPDESPSILQQVSATMDGRMLTAALSRIPTVPATIVQLKTADGLTFDQIARHMGMPLNTVKSQYRRALASLRLLLEKI